MYKKYDILKGDKSERVLDRRFITNLCMNGVPMGLQYSITAIGSTILQAAVNTLGSTYVAAMTAGSKMFNFTCCPFDALGSTMATYAGQNVGAAKIKRLGQGVRSAMIIGSVYSVLSLIALYFTTDYIALLFVNASETTIIALTRQFILASACFYIPLTGVNVVRFCIQGMGFSVFAISAGILEMIGRAFAAIILIPSIDSWVHASPHQSLGLLLTHFYSLHSYIVPRSLMQGTILNQTNNMTKGRTILPSLIYSII